MKELDTSGHTNSFGVFFTKASCEEVQALIRHVKPDVSSQLNVFLLRYFSHRLVVQMFLIDQFEGNLKCDWSCDVSNLVMLNSNLELHLK